MPSTPATTILSLLLSSLACGTARHVTPFFDHRQQSLEVTLDAQGTVDHVHQLKTGAMRRLATGYEDNAWKDIWKDVEYEIEKEKEDPYAAEDYPDPYEPVKEYPDPYEPVKEETKPYRPPSNEDSGKGKGFLKRKIGKGKSSKSSKKSSSSSGKGKGGKGRKGKGRGKGDFSPEPCYDCDIDDVEVDFEFVLVRDEIGTDSMKEYDFGIGSGIGLNGHIFETIYTSTGRDFGGESIGVFKGFCTVVSDSKGELLCTYEIFIYTPGQFGVGGVVVTGPVAGLQSEKQHQAVVTGAEYDFQNYQTGVLTTVQDPQKPILFAQLTFH